MGSDQHGPVILATNDGGNTWKTQDAGTTNGAGQLGAVAFADTAHGWTVWGPVNANTAPTILATSDGGATWKEQDASSAGSSARLAAVAFVDATHGWTVGFGGDESGVTGAVILATSK